MKEIKNRNEFNEVINQDKPVLLDFYADWCGPCQVLLPTIEKIADEYAGQVEVRKINVDSNPELAREFNVRSIPALFILENKTVTQNLVGIQTYNALSELLNEKIGNHVS